MNWVDNNPVALALVAVCGFLLLVGLALGLAWSGPPSVDATALADSEPQFASAPEGNLELGPANDYQIISDRPLFNESRRPEVVEVVEETPQQPEPVETEVADRPDVRLTGVVLTPDRKFVTLTPNSGGDPVVTQIGMPLEAEFVGWTVDVVRARSVRLKSAKGERMNLELTVHDQMIEAPPEPEPIRQAAADELEEGAEGEERLTRAEEIRRRIAERREQLRLEAEEAEALEAEEQQAQRSDYQEAIRSLMTRNRNNDENDADENE